MLTVVFVTIFRSFDEENEMDTQGDDNTKLNKCDSDLNVILFSNFILKNFLVKIKWKKKYKQPSNDEFNPGPTKETNSFAQSELDAMKIKQYKRNKCRKIIHEIFINMIFLGVLFLLSYLNVNANSYNYQNHVKSMFVKDEQVLKALRSLTN